MLLFFSANRAIVLTSAKGCCGFEHHPPPPPLKPTNLTQVPSGARGPVE